MREQHFSWRAPEYEKRDHSSDWYWVVGIITVALAIAFFIVDNMLLSIILIIGVGTLLAHAGKDPDMVEYEISRKGIRINKTLYHWDSLESFWILEAQDHGDHVVAPRLLITSAKQFVPHIVISLGDQDAEQIREVLVDRLMETPQTEPLYDVVMRRLGF